MKTKITLSVVTAFAVLVLFVGNAFARSVQTASISKLSTRPRASLFMLKNGIQLREDRSTSDKSLESKSSESIHELESRDDRSSEIESDDSSGSGLSDSSFIGSLPTIQSSQIQLTDDSQHSSYEIEDLSHSDRSTSTSDSSESHSGSHGEPDSGGYDH